MDKTEILTTAIDLMERAEKAQEYRQEEDHRALLYYYGKYPRPPEEDRSSHVSYDVYDSIESIKAKILAMLSADQDVVRFKERTLDDEATAKLATEYVNDQMFRKNEGYLIMHDVIFDALLMRIGAVRCDWVEQERTEEQIARAVPEDGITMLEAEGWTVQEREPVDEVPPEILQQLAAAGVDPAMVPPLFNVTITRQVPDNHTKLEVIAPENFYVIEDPADNDMPDFYCERCAMVTGDLLNEYDAADVEMLPHYMYDDIEIARVQYAEHSSNMYESEVLESRREREVYRAYIRADFDKENEMKWYEVIFGKNVLLEYSEVDEPPFFYWSPIRISHRSIGRSYADVTMSIQDGTSMLRRGIIDNTMQGNMPRTIVNENLLEDMSEVMDHSVGSVINSSDVDRSVRELPPASLPQGAVIALEIMGLEKQARTGFSAVAQGMNPDAISNQNAKDTIEMYAKAGQQRPAQIARMFAEKLLKPLMRRIFRLGVKYENIGNIMNLDAVTIQNNPGAWSEKDLDMEVSVALTEDEKTAEAMQLLSLHQVMASDPANAHLYPDKNRAAVLGRAAELLNLDKALLLSDVESPEYQQSKQQETQQQQMVIELQKAQAQAQMQLAAMQLQLQQLMADRDFQLKQAELKLKAQSEQHDQQIDEAKVDLDQKELILSMQKTGAEISIETQQQRPAAID